MKTLAAYLFIGMASAQAATSFLPISEGRGIRLSDARQVFQVCLEGPQGYAAQVARVLGLRGQLRLSTREHNSAGRMVPSTFAEALRDRAWRGLGEGEIWFNPEHALRAEGDRGSSVSLQAISPHTTLLDLVGGGETTKLSLHLGLPSLRFVASREVSEGLDRLGRPVAAVRLLQGVVLEVNRHYDRPQHVANWQTREHTQFSIDQRTLVACLKNGLEAAALR